MTNYKYRLPIALTNQYLLLTALTNNLPCFIFRIMIKLRGQITFQVLFLFIVEFFILKNQLRRPLCNPILKWSRFYFRFDQVSMLNVKIYHAYIIYMIKLFACIYITFIYVSLAGQTAGPNGLKFEGALEYQGAKKGSKKYRNFIF